MWSHIYDSSEIMQNEIRGFHKNAFKEKVDSFNSDQKVNNCKVVNYMKIIFIKRKTRNAIGNSMGKPR